MVTHTEQGPVNYGYIEFQEGNAKEPIAMHILF
jgi:hypothetical protein